MNGPSRATITVVVNTCNEERRIAFALGSVRAWADQIVVVDMESRDRTRDVAREFGAVVIEHAAIGYVEPARRVGCDAASSDWVLVIDADEMVPAPLAGRLRDVASRPDVDAVRIPRLNYLLGSPLRHTGWNPDRDRHLRFFRKGRVELPTGIHVPIRALDPGRAIDLQVEEGAWLVHFNYVDVDDFLSRMNRYTTIEAGQAEPARSRWPLAAALRDAGREWCARYLWHGGYRDGWRGFVLAWGMATYRLAVHAKRIERAEVGSHAEVEAAYGREAERILAGYAARPAR